MRVNKELATRIGIELTYEEMNLLSKGKTIECRLKDHEDDLVIIEISIGHGREG